MGSSGDPRWLDADEAEAWRALVSVLYTLPQALDADMQYHAGMTLYDYLVMAALSETPDRAIRLSELAIITNASLPRLSQVVTKLQRRGWIKRRPDPDDRRTTLAVMTADGMKMLVKAAPAHVEQVRKLVFDSLTNAQVRQLSEISRRIRKTIGPLYENSNQVAGDRWGE